MAKISALVDSFNDNSIDTIKWVAFGDPRQSGPILALISIRGEWVKCNLRR